MDVETLSCCQLIRTEGKSVCSLGQTCLIQSSNNKRTTEHDRKASFRKLIVSFYCQLYYLRGLQKIINFMGRRGGSVKVRRGADKATGPGPAFSQSVLPRCHPAGGRGGEFAGARGSRRVGLLIETLALVR